MTQNQLIGEFTTVVGGELPLSPAEAELWSRPGEAAPAIESLQNHFGGPESCLWLGFSRSAMAVALDLAGVKAHHTVSLPSYQCQAVIRKLRSRTEDLAFYPLTEDFLPKSPEFSHALHSSKAVVTCVYFGSTRVDQVLNEVIRDARRESPEAWIIEDRVMCFPGPLDIASLGERCDFAVLGFRKHYPVPDGALLIGCSDRARSALRRFQHRSDADAAFPKYISVIRQKAQAKEKRHAWLASDRKSDEPSQNGVPESQRTEAAVEEMLNHSPVDFLPGSAGSAAYLAQRDLQHDEQRVEQVSKQLFDALQSTSPSLLVAAPQGCRGVGLPMVIPDRDRVRSEARNRGLFLPVHWPRHDLAPLRPEAQHWHDHELTLPTSVIHSPSQVDYLISQIPFVRTLS